MKSHRQKEEENHLVIHYLTLRKILGFMGLLLPVALLLGSAILYKSGPETSISNYYYTTLRDVFIVTLCAVSLFLLAYKGYERGDKWASNIAGVFGLIAAFVSTNPKPGINYVKHVMAEPVYKDKIFESFKVMKTNCPPEGLVNIPYPQHDFVGYIHLTCAAIFFLSLAYISYFQFTKSTGPVTPQKIWRNRIYKFCGAVMLFCILALVPCFFKPELKLWYDQHKLIFWAESISLWMFGTSWLIKGEFILKDK